MEMLERIIEQQQAISAVLAEDRKNWHRMPTDGEWSTLENVVEVLKPLAYLTDALSGEKQVTASAILPVLRHELNLRASDNQLVTDMKQAIWSNLKAQCADPVVSSGLFSGPKVQRRHAKQGKYN